MEKIKKFKFKPSKELLEFAEQVSKKYKKLTPQTLVSEKGTYTINILPKIINDLTKTEYPTAFRVGLTSQTIQFSKRQTKEVCANFIYFGILWCVCCYEYNNFHKQHSGNLSSIERFLHIDKLTAEQYQKSGRSLKRVHKDISNNFKKSAPNNVEMNKERIKAIYEIIKKLK